jgi:hypothetical protein
MMDGKGGQGLESSKSQFTVSKPDRRYSYRDMNYLIGKVWKTSTPYGYPTDAPSYIGVDKSP